MTSMWRCPNPSISQLHKQVIGTTANPTMLLPNVPGAVGVAARNDNMPIES